jgi:hypothetical protein
MGQYFSDENLDIERMEGSDGETSVPHGYCVVLDLAFFLFFGSIASLDDPRL